MVIDAIKMALKNMDREYCMLSKIDYHELKVDEPIRENLSKEKYLERPFAYEFYHQLRKLMDNGEVDFGGPKIQAEVAKRYQHCLKNGKIPDFIIHIPNTGGNHAVIEFKLASNLSDIEYDFIKLVEFKQSLGYLHLVQVVIGDSSSLGKARERIDRISTNHGEKIIIIGFNVETWETEMWEIKYRCNVAQ